MGFSALFLFFTQDGLFVYICFLEIYSFWWDFFGFSVYSFHFGFACSCLQRINFMIKLIHQL